MTMLKTFWARHRAGAQRVESYLCVCTVCVCVCVCVYTVCAYLCVHLCIPTIFIPREKTSMSGKMEEYSARL